MRTVVLYIFLVGLPIAGTSLVLKSGRHLQAPQAIRGIWTLQIAGDSKATGCPALAGLGPSPTFVVGQSGDRLAISLGESSAPAMLGRLSFGGSDPSRIAAITAQEADHGPDGAALVTLNANIDLTSVPLAMEGAFIAPACDAGRPIAFRATLRPPINSKDGSH